jgi:carbonic anhydrase
VDKPDGLAVLGMFIKVGAEHPEFGKLCEVLQDIPRKGDVINLKEPIDPAGFLPKNQSYWTYLGSLTTPPLCESVTWTVFKQPIEVSPVQLKIMREMRQGDDTSEYIRDNYRPACPLHGRTVRQPKFL